LFGGEVLQHPDVITTTQNKIAPFVLILLFYWFNFWFFEFFIAE
jgi:hypothetical protein